MIDSTTIEKKNLADFENNKSNLSYPFSNLFRFRIRAIEKIYSSIVFSYLIKEFKRPFFFSVVFSFISEILYILASTRALKIFTEADKFDVKNIINFSEKQKRSVIILVAFFAVSSVFDFLKNFTIDIIENDSFYFIKRKTIEKFLGLKIEDKILKKADVSMINEEEAWTIAEKWNHIAVHFSSSIFKIISLFIISETREAILEAGTLGIVLILSFVTFSSFLNVYFFNILDKKREELKIPTKEEAYLTEKETSKAILIENMGLKKNYLFKRDEVVRNLNNKFYNLELLSNCFFQPLEFLCNSYPFLLIAFFFSPSKKNIFYLTAFDRTLSAFNSLAGCYRDVKILNFSLGIVDNFLSIPSKDENQSGVKLLGEEIDFIKFENVSFAYTNSEEKIISEYSKSFSKSRINRIEGKNGTGKSTILYLLLGTVDPLSGRILVRTESGGIFDINKEVNLVDWKENVVAYISHENLFENDEGSTGQKQIMNIDQIISEKKSAKIFLFDEADNSLDENNKKLFYRKVDELVSNNKIVILISH